MSPLDRTKPPPPVGGEDDLIELTEVVEEAPLELTDEATAEVVLDFRVGSGELASFMISGISVQPSTTASQLASFIRALTR